MYFGYQNQKTCAQPTSDHGPLSANGPIWHTSSWGNSLNFDWHRLATRSATLSSPYLSPKHRICWPRQRPRQRAKSPSWKMNCRSWANALVGWKHSFMLGLEERSTWIEIGRLDSLQARQIFGKVWGNVFPPRHLVLILPSVALSDLFFSLSFSLQDVLVNILSLRLLARKFSIFFEVRCPRITFFSTQCGPLLLFCFFTLPPF